MRPLKNVSIRQVGYPQFVLKSLLITRGALTQAPDAKRFSSDDSPTASTPQSQERGARDEVRNNCEYERIICERPIVPTLSPDKAL
jgi:hypothetical protein